MSLTFRRVTRYLRVNGARKTAAAIGRKLRELFYREVRLIVTEKDLRSVVEPRSEGALRVEELGPEQMKRLAELNRRRGRPDVQRLFERYAERGFHGLLACSGDEPIGYYWWVDRDVPAGYTDPHKLNLGFELAEGEAYGSHFFLLEEHRGGGVAAEFLFKVESLLRDSGYTRLWGFVASGNRPARWLYSTRGYKPMWVVKLRRIMLVERATREPS